MRNKAEHFGIYLFTKYETELYCFKLNPGASSAILHILLQQFSNLNYLNINEKRLRKKIVISFLALKPCSLLLRT